MDLPPKPTEPKNKEANLANLFLVQKYTQTVLSVFKTTASHTCVSFAVFINNFSLQIIKLDFTVHIHL